MSRSAPHIGFVSLGCSKALVDSERIITRLRAEGYGIAADYAGCDLVVVNTCGFIEAAIEESLASIAEALAENGRVIVTGCLGARARLIEERFPEVLAVTGPQAYDEVLAAVHRHLPPPHDPYTSLVPPQGIRLTPRHYAYLKIAEGCNHRCTFCVIPSLRGPLSSRPIGEVMSEAEGLIEAGVKELLVIAQDTAAYGADAGYRTGFWGGRPIRTRFFELAQTLGGLGVWVRLHYVYPYPHVDAVMALMAEGRILPYLDVPFQHASARILKAMKRPADREDMLERIRSWRAICPDLTLRSTFIVGFPGETEEDFTELLDFLREAELDRVGCFPYSAVAGAAANALPGQVPEPLKQERFRRFMEVQAGISAAKLRRRIGQRLTVLVDEVRTDMIVARSAADAPEVDGTVQVEYRAGIAPGNLLEVTVTDATEHDLQARPVFDHNDIATL